MITTQTHTHTLKRYSGQGYGRVHNIRLKFEAFKTDCIRNQRHSTDGNIIFLKEN